MMGQAVKTSRSPALREPLVFRQGVCNSGKIARAKQRGNPRDIGLESERREVVVQRDVLVEIVWNSLRFVDGRHRAGGLGRQLNAALDLTNFGGVVVNDAAIADAEIFFDGSQFRQNRIQN